MVPGRHPVALPDVVSGVPRFLPSVLLLLAVLLLSGCTGAPTDADTAAQPEVVVVTDPDDFSYLTNETESGNDVAHLHDYWGLEETRLVLDQTQHEQLGLAGAPVTLASFRAPAGGIVPLGTSNLTIDVSWTEDADTHYDHLELAVKSAADNEAVPLTPVASGDSVAFPVTAEMWDLPHQTLSAWSFDLIIHPDQTTGGSRFEGDIRVVVIAERGLPIPLFPAHPDPWEGRDAIHLLSESGDVAAFQGDPGGGSCASDCILFPYVPDDGALVPRDTAYVEVVLTLGPRTPTSLDLSFHGADQRDFDRLQPDEVSADGNTKTYRIPVDGARGDGPYATQSQWEFRLEATTPDPPYGNYSGTFELVAQAVRVAEAEGA